jgi:hypothetical protein
VTHSPNDTPHNPGYGVPVPRGRGMDRPALARLASSNPKPRYNRREWVLCECVECWTLNYVEPHGTTAECKKCRRVTEHKNIPFRSDE